MRPVKGWLILLVMLTGCTGGTSATPPSPTPNLGAEYTRIAAPLNASLVVLANAMNATPQDNASIRKATAASQAAEVKFNADLLSLAAEAPTNVRTDIDVLRKAIAAKEVLTQGIVNATDENIVAAVNAFASYSVTGAASRVKSDLGLASAPNTSPAP